MTDQFENFQSWVTGGAGEGEPALPVDDIQQAMEDDLSALGTLHTDLSNMPETATERPNGTFFDYDDLRQYLDDGGLLLLDGDGLPIPNPIVHIYRFYDEDYDVERYEVYIDEDTPQA